MDITQAIEALNNASVEKIETLTTRDGRQVAKLPRLGKEVLIGDSQFHPEAKVSARDIAFLCREARLAMEPIQGFLDAALAMLDKLPPD